MRIKKKKITSYKKIYLLFLIISTLFMGIGYAKVNDTLLVISGVTESYPQEGVFITDVVYVSDVEADTVNSKITYYWGTMLDSQITLGNVSSSSITYKISLYNNSDIEYLFIDTLTDFTNTNLYSNSNIEYNLSGLEEYVTTISPNEKLEFTMTFSYVSEADLSKNNLVSKLNFRFKEIPNLVLSSEGEVYTLSDIYPDYVPKEYQFTVSNYSNNEINNVPMTYHFETSVDSPLTVKIYDDTGAEVTNGINIGGNGVDKVQHTYTLKVIWDSSNPDENIDYNSSDYAGQTFKCNVVLKAVPDDTEYIDYVVMKEFVIDITTASFNFNVDVDQDIGVEKEGSNLAVLINNSNSTSEYNKYDVDYELSIDDNDKFSYSIDGESSVNNVFSRTLSGGELIDDSYSVLLSADINDLDVTETATLNIVVKSPYVKEISLPLTISLQPLTVNFNANGGSVSPTTLVLYKGKTYSELPTPTRTGHTFNGWYTAASGGTKITSTTEVTIANSTQTLYAQWTSRLLADYVSTGDYVAYDISYSNVGTTTPASGYTGWRVLDVKEDDEGNSYVRLITAGIPMMYDHPKNTSSSTVGSTSVKNLTTNFFSTEIATTSTDNKFYLCGFLDGSTNITSIADLATLFKNNVHTQVNGTTPVVQSVTVDDIEDVFGITVANVTSVSDNDMIGIPSSTSSKYAPYYIAGVAETYYIWVSYTSGYIVYTYGAQGVRPVVSLKTTVETTGQVDGVWQLN